MSAAMSEDRVRPSAWWIVLSVVIFVLGVGGCSALVVVSAVRAFDVDTILSAEGSINLEAGDYTVYVTEPSTTVIITTPDGDPVELDDYDGDASVTRDDTEYDAAFTFEPPVDGRYGVIRQGAGSVAIGEGIGKQLGLAGVGVLIGLVGFVAGLVIFIITLVKRSSSRNRIKARQFAAAGPPAYPHPGSGGAWSSPPPPPPPSPGAWGPGAPPPPPSR